MSIVEIENEVIEEFEMFEDYSIRQVCCLFVIGSTIAPVEYDQMILLHWQ